MRRYHFSIQGGHGQLGLAGAIFAENDKSALVILQGFLNDVQTHNQGVGNEPDLAGYGDEYVSEDGDEEGISYCNLYTNGITATMEMFDEIEDVE